MNSQNSKETSIQVKAAIIAGAFALLAAVIGGIFLILNTMIDKGAILINTPTTISTITSVQTPTLEQIQPSPGTTEATNWAITFSYHFSSGFWSVGTHEYTLEADCPNLEDGSGSWTNTFDVSENAVLLPGDVYLRLVGLRDGPLPSNPVDSINPLQTTTASLSFIEISHSEADLAFRDCQITVRWDGTSPQLLTPGLPFER